MSRAPLLGVPAIMTCVVASYLAIDVTVWVYQSHSDARSVLLGVPELVLNFELDNVLFESVC